MRTLEATANELRNQGHEVKMVGPEANLWNTISAPSYPSIKLEFFGRERVRRIVKDYQPDYIHISTEGPLGWSARNLCLESRLPFTTSYHTRFPEYLAARVPTVLAKPVRVFTYAGLRRFHTPSSAIMVSTPSLERELHRRKFRRIAHWSRGVNTELFQPYGKDLSAYENLERPIQLYVGRVAVEKNLRAFLDINSPGTKVVIGEGPDLALLKGEYPQAHFMGSMEGETLARHYAASDLFVFPSTTDTFGLVLLEACAAGLRIASYPAPGPVDIFAKEAAQSFAVLDSDLEQAVNRALALPDATEAPRRFAETFSWQACTGQFFNHLQAPTPKAVKRITRLRNWLSRWWQHALALQFK
ncbi:MAG TPA: glycosyltransferase family 1 protein [Alphaproteobacteria bacterium]|nr:glycosyltransferase family 1 protein [Alphaproteobacteria bacterium]